MPTREELKALAAERKARLAAKLKESHAAADAPKATTPRNPETPKAETAADSKRKPSPEDQKHRRQFLRMYDRKAKLESDRLTRAGVKSDDPARKIQIAPKWMPVANRLGIKELHGLRVTL